MRSRAIVSHSKFDGGVGRARYIRWQRRRGSSGSIATLVGPVWGMVSQSGVKCKGPGQRRDVTSAPCRKHPRLGGCIAGQIDHIEPHSDREHEPQLGRSNSITEAPVLARPIKWQGEWLYGSLARIVRKPESLL